MKYKATSVAIFLLTAASGDSICSAFSTNGPLSTSQQQIIHHQQHTSSSSSSSSISTTTLHAKRRGKLINNVSLDDDGNVKLISNKQKQKLGSSKSKRNNEAVSISPLLAEWATEGDDDSTASSSSSSSSSAEKSFDNTAALSKSDIFVPFDDNDDDSSSSNNKKKRKGSKKNRKSNVDDRTGTGTKLSSTQLASMNSILDDINEMVEKTNCDVSDIVNQITSLVDLGSTFGSNNQILLPTLKSILSYRPNPKDESDTQPSYRLAWVGSDDAICHIGTSLHKVPLARLQEMYLLLGYNNRWELLEVIRILGPFPNVRNTLKGEVTMKKNNMSQKREGVRMEIAYQSMIDGTGKEILAGKDDNVKRVKLDVWFANEQALVCTTVPEDGDESEGGNGGDPLSGDGSNILLFVKEEDLDGNLEKLRAV